MNKGIKAVMTACAMCAAMTATAQTDPKWAKAYEAYITNMRTENQMIWGFVTDMVEKLKPTNPGVSEKQWADYTKEVVKAASSSMVPEGGKVEQKYKELLSKLSAKELSEINAIAQNPAYKKHQEILLKGNVGEPSMEEFIQNMGNTGMHMEKSAAAYGIKL